MKTYRNLSGKSGVVRYEYGPDYIIVEFKDGWKFEYTHTSAGRVRIDHMKQLADGGLGLNTYINAEVKNMYSRKWR